MYLSFPIKNAHFLAQGVLLKKISITVKVVIVTVGFQMHVHSILQVVLNSKVLNSLNNVYSEKIDSKTKALLNQSAFVYNLYFILCSLSSASLRLCVKPSHGLLNHGVRHLFNLIVYKQHQLADVFRREIEFQTSSFIQFRQRTSTT